MTTGFGTVPRDRVHGLTDEYDRVNLDLLVRPDDVRAVPAAEADGGAPEGTDGPHPVGRVRTRRYLGPTVLYEVELDDGTTVECMHNHDESIPLDRQVGLELEADHDLAWFPADQRTRDVAVDPDAE